MISNASTLHDGICPGMYSINLWCLCLGPSVSDDQRLYGFIRVTTGDEMSKRAKFVLVTFIGDSVGVLKKARVSTDKSQVKQIIQVPTSLNCCERLEQSLFFITGLQNVD